MKSQKNSPKKQSEQLKAIRYIGLASQMIGIILLGAFLGRWLDQRFQTEQAYFTAGTTLMTVFASLWYVFKDLIKK